MLVGEGTTASRGAPGIAEAVAAGRKVCMSPFPGALRLPRQGVDAPALGSLANPTSIAKAMSSRVVLNLNEIPFPGHFICENFFWCPRKSN